MTDQEVEKLQCILFHRERFGWHLLGTAALEPEHAPKLALWWQQRAKVRTTERAGGQH